MIGNTSFFYDASNSRYQKRTITNGGDSLTTYIGKQYEETIINGQDTIQKNFIYFGNKLIATKTNKSATDYMHSDTQGNIVAISNSNGHIINRRSYTPFGEIRHMEYQEGMSNALNSLNLNNRGYSGHEHIDNTELIHMNGRVYDPTIGRFMSADPFIQAPTDTQSYNRYSYVRNNPVNLIDPSGYSWLSKLADKVVGAALITAGYFLAIIPEPTGLSKFIATTLISTGGGLLSGEMQLFSKDENGNRYIGIQGQISTNWGQSTNSLTSHQSNMIASQISDERLYHHDITYNYKNMNGAMSDNFSYTADSSGVALYGDSWVGGNGKISMYGDGDKIIITKHMKPSLNVNAAVWSNYAYEAFTYTNVGSVYDSVQQYNNGTMSGYELAGYGAIGAMFGGVGVKGAKYIDKVSDVIHVTPKVLLFHQIIKYQIIYSKSLSFR